MKISTILDQIDLGSIALPEFQRGYVWNRDQVRGLMDSLYRRHPVGSLLVWLTKTENATARGDGALATGTVQLLLDGQQRITSLYGIMRGQPPRFFESDPKVFSGLHFNLEDETFEFYAPLKMRGNPLWIDVTTLMREGMGSEIQRLADGDPTKFKDFYSRLAAVDGIREVDLHIEQVTGEDKTIDVVVDIFNKVNSGGTKLSKGDLALAKICAQWPEARERMNDELDRWEKAGFNFRLEWLLRCTNAIVTGEALFNALAEVPIADIQQGLGKAIVAIDSLLNLISSRLGLDHDRVLGSRYSFPVMAHYLVRRGGKLTNYRERDKLLYWYVQTLLWGRYSGTTESVINQDLGLIEDLDGGIERLVGELRQQRGDLTIQPNDFRGWSKGARFYPLLYMLTRVSHSRDWCSGVELSDMLLGKLSALQVHHIFPKSLLYKAGYAISEVNAIANFSFLTQECNLEVSDRDPSEYLEEIAERHPGVLESHWMPMDRELWKINRYLDFLDARRVLLAEAANRFLDSLWLGNAALEQVAQPVLDHPAAIVTSIAGDDEERDIFACIDWINAHGLPDGEMLYELTDPMSGQPTAILDLAWPNGIQQGLSQPVALLLDEPKETEDAANRAGFRYFTSVDTFKEYVEREILARSVA